MIIGPVLLNFRFRESRITLWPTDEKGKYTVMLARMKGNASESTEYFSFPSASCALDAIAGIFSK